MKSLKFKFLFFNILLLGNMFNPFILKFGNAYAADSSDEILENYIHQVPKNKFYILGSGDFIKLEVSENVPELSRVFSINGEGYSKLPKLNLIYTKLKPLLHSLRTLDNLEISFTSTNLSKPAAFAK